MPKPVLQAMVLADHVYQDRQTGKFVIAGTFSTIFLGTRKVSLGTGDDEGKQVIRGPVTTIGSPYLYFALLEVHGEVSLQIKFVNLADATVIFEAALAVTAADPVAVAEYSVPLLPIQVLAGEYSLDLLHENEILGSWRVSVRAMETPSGDVKV